MGWSTESAKKDIPNKVSGLVVKHLISLILPEGSTANLISHPKDFPIQFFCIILTLLGHSSSRSKFSNNSLENLVILKNH